MKHRDRPRSVGVARRQDARRGRPGGAAWLRAISLCVAGVLTGCAGLPIGTVPAPDTPAPGHGQGPVAPEYHPAAQALVDEARREAVLGRDAAAGATLERALRIDSRNPWIWIELGNLRLAAGDLAATRSMAQKALSLAQGDPAARAAAAYLLRQADGGS